MNKCRNFTKVLSLLKSKAFINGEWVKVGSTFPVQSPYSGKEIGQAPNCNQSDANNAVRAAQKAFRSWKQTCAKERSQFLQRWLSLVIENKQELAEIITLENLTRRHRFLLTPDNRTKLSLPGKPITQALGEIDYAATFIEWCAEEAKRSYGITIPSPHAEKRLISIKQPLGVAGLITPWNFPCAMITRKACAAIAAGCTVVLKPSECTPFSALALAQLAQEAGLPCGVLNIMPSTKERAQEIGEAMCQHPDVGVISFTGSTTTGKVILRNSASTVKKVSLELGGLSPFIVFKDADIENTVKQAMLSKFRNMGQACVASNRFFVENEVHDEFVEKLLNAMKAELKLGDPMAADVTIGPLINKDGVAKAHAQVEDALKHGATLHTGSGRSELGELFFEPTLLTNVTPSMMCFQQESFAPIVPITRFESEAEVLKMANDCTVGLAGYIFSENIRRCWRVAEQLEVGVVGINEGIVSLAEAPMGGVKESGLGREGSHDSLDEFMETKYLCLRFSI